MARRRDAELRSGWRPLQEAGGTGDDLDRFRLPDTPFARLGLAHAGGSAGDTLVSIALAKTLFFVSPAEARGKVLLYLLLTLAPFAVVSPFIGPLVDRFHQHRRWVVVAAAVLRGVLCFFMARDVTSLLLFPEAFTVLVLSKGYAVARSALVPGVVPDDRELVRANSRLALIAGLSGFVAAVPGGLLSLGGAPWVLRFAVFVFGLAAILGARIQVIQQHETSRTVEHVVRDGLVRAEPRRRSRVRRVEPAVELRLAAVAMSAQRSLVGFVTFLLSFTLKREEALVWLGVVGGAGVAGGLLGSIVAPQLRDRFDESRILATQLILAGLTCVAAGFSDARPAAAAVALVIGFGAGVSRLAFDALVQRDAADHARGSAFARYETRFQLMWVLGALVPVVFPISRPAGFLVMAVLALVATAINLGGEAALARIDATKQASVDRWRRTRATAEDDDWDSFD